MVRVLHDEHEGFEACRERLLDWERTRFVRGEVSIEELERRLERTLSDDSYVNSERHYWSYR